MPKRTKKLDHLNLAEGEVTLHFHAASEGAIYETEDPTVYEYETDGATVTHQEHGAVVVPGGVYERHLVQTVDEDEEVRAIRD